jgi:putative ABC transport system ATP-binding protein
MKTCIIKTEKICKSFITDGEINNVIKNMDLEIYQGDFTVIMGSSGSGKSTLMYLLSGMDKVTSGDVYLKERNITNCKENELASIRKDNIGFVFQGMNLIPDLTIRENVISPTYKSKIKKNHLNDRVDYLLENMELKEHENKFPGQLSGGQKQRTAICRSLINQPELLFADEPTGALNSSAGENVLDSFTSINENGQSIVMVTHDLKAAVRGNRVIFIKDGRIDGELELSTFHKEEASERENMIYDFLKERGW